MSHRPSSRAWKSGSGTDSAAKNSPGARLSNPDTETNTSKSTAQMTLLNDGKQFPLTKQREKR
ncbi:MAG: hypothetical protein CMM01_06960 [Rhodopirellula sp.]|nr:hypothetical protein [Rhodopirellula sp.]OUX51887.1 MAG: hypothetical protein CBE43_02310 [Rhodopirellula sp. TMED283]